MIPQNYPLYALAIGPDQDTPIVGPVTGWAEVDGGWAPVVACGPVVAPLTADTVVGFVASPPHEYDVAKFMDRVAAATKQEEAAA